MKGKFALTNGKIWDGYDVYSDHALLIDGDKVHGIFDQNAVPDVFERIDMHQANVCPGLIDLQIYGAGEDLFSAQLSASSFARIERNLLQQGCTTCLLTLATNTLAVFKEAISVFKNSKPKMALGLHLEGPFLNPLKRGAHPEELIIRATAELIDELLKDADGIVKMMTVAPECMDVACLEKLLTKGIVLSAGHSMASCEQATQGFRRGIRATTHLWNAMSAFQHRNVGLPGATFLHDDVVASIIADGIHVDFEAVKLSKQLLGERLFLITDAVAPSREGIYQHILSEDRYILPDGTLSGSALTLLRAIKNCVEKVGIPLGEAIRMATTYPARLLGHKDIGTFRKGSKANVLVFNASYEVESVYLGGEKVV